MLNLLITSDLDHPDTKVTVDLSDGRGPVAYFKNDVIEFLVLNGMKTLGEHLGGGETVDRLVTNEDHIKKLQGRFGDHRGGPNEK